MKLVNLAKYNFIIEPRYYFFGWTDQPKILGRESAVKILVEARRFLPKGYNFKIWDCYRPYEVQKAMLKSFRRRINLMYADLSKKEREKLVQRFGGKLVKNVAALYSHRVGGAFDLTIVDKKGNELYMGTDHDDLTEKAATDYFLNLPAQAGKKNLTELEKEVKKNRELLKEVLIKAGLKNYEAEWWHWSYDK